MITISTLQSQISLNQNKIASLEKFVRLYLVDDHYLKIQANKQIKQYAKLQRALKSELAYRIMYNREMRSNNMEQYQLK